MQNYANMAPGFGGFGCSKNALIAVNVLYICVSVSLMGVAGYGLAGSSISSFGVIIAITTISVFLFIIAVVGIVAAIKHHQVMLFFYMVILFVLFILQFSVACACLAVGDEQIHTLMSHGYRLASNETRGQVQEHWDCCGFDRPSPDNTTILSADFNSLILHPSCSSLPCCQKPVAGIPDSQTCCDVAGHADCPCDPCFRKLEEVIKASLRLCGGIGLFFSFTEVVGIFMALRFRNQKNPHIDPSDFL